MKSAGWAKWVPSAICSKGSAPSSSRACSTSSGSCSALTAAIVDVWLPWPGKSKAVSALEFGTCKEYWSGRPRR